MHNFQGDGLKQDCTQFAVLILCDDSTVCDVIAEFCHRSRHNDRHCK